MLRDLKHTFQILAITILISSCSTIPGEQDWQPQAPATGTHALSCLSSIQNETRGKTLAFSWKSQQLAVDYHYGISSLTKDGQTKFVIQDEFNNSYQIKEAISALKCDSNHSSYCFLLTLPIMEKPTLNFAISLNNGQLSVSKSDRDPNPPHVTVESELIDRNLVQEDIQRRRRNHKYDFEAGQITRNAKRSIKLKLAQQACLDHSL